MAYDTFNEADLYKMEEMRKHRKKMSRHFQLNVLPRLSTEALLSEVQRRLLDFTKDPEPAHDPCLEKLGLLDLEQLEAVLYRVHARMKYEYVQDKREN